MSDTLLMAIMLILSVWLMCGVAIISFTDWAIIIPITKKNMKLTNTPI